MDIGLTNQNFRCQSAQDIEGNQYCWKKPFGSVHDPPNLYLISK